MVRAQLKDTLSEKKDPFIHFGNNYEKLRTRLGKAGQKVLVENFAFKKLTYVFNLHMIYEKLFYRYL